eukprot:293354_1
MWLFGGTKRDNYEGNLTTSERKCKLDELLKKIAHQHADIPTISPLEIQGIEKDENQKLWLVDVRGPEEMKVSMIKGSISKAKFEEAPPEPSDPKNVFVPYCTIGGRSGAYCNELKRRGYTRVFNGTGILEWTHEIGGDLVTAQGDHTVRVHVNSRKFDYLLPPEFLSVF